MDDSGTPRYGDDGKPLSVDQYVSEWLTSNPHFVASTPGGSGSQSQTANNTVGNKVDISRLDMSRKDHREQYAEWRKQRDSAR